MSIPPAWSGCHDSSTAVQRRTCYTCPPTSARRASSITPSAMANSPLAAAAASSTATETTIRLPWYWVACFSLIACSRQPSILTTNAWHSSKGRCGVCVCVFVLYNGGSPPSFSGETCTTLVLHLSSVYVGYYTFQCIFFVQLRPSRVTQEEGSFLLNFFFMPHLPPAVRAEKMFYREKGPTVGTREKSCPAASRRRQKTGRSNQ